MTHYAPYVQHHKIKTLDDSHSNSQKSALIIVDVQNDLVSKIKDDVKSNMMINSINELIVSDIFDYYVYTHDIHKPGSNFFASTHGLGDFEVKDNKIMWPDHCLSNTKGSQLAPNLITAFDKSVVTNMVDDYADNKIFECKKYSDQSNQSKLLEKSYVLLKGLDEVDPYSAFKDSEFNETGLAGFLIDHGVKNVYVCGLFRDFGVWWSVADGTSYESEQKKLFNMYCVLDATLSMNQLPKLALKLPEYLELKKSDIDVDSVFVHLNKNDAEGNLWVKHFLEPYGVKTVSWQDIKPEQTIHKGGSKSIFVKMHEPTNDLRSNNVNIDFNFIKKIAKN